MNTRIKISFLLIAFMVMSSAIAFAQPGNQGNFKDGKSVNDKYQKSPGQCPFSRKGHHKEHFGCMPIQVLDLSQGQQEQLKAIQAKTWEGKIALFKEKEIKMQELDRELIKDVSDNSRINELKSQIVVLESKMLDLKLNSLLEIKKFLSLQQFAGFMALKKERAFSGHHNHGMGYGHKDKEPCAHHAEDKGL